MLKNRNNGFTLIELLAVIMIIAIISLITIPIIINVIGKIKIESLKNSAYGIINSGENHIINERLKGDKKLYLSIDFPENEKLIYKGRRPERGNLTIHKDGKSSILAIYGDYCAVKQKNQKEVIVVKKDDDRCVREITESNPECFDFDEKTGTISNYKCFPENDFSLPVITDVIIPSLVNDVEVEIIGTGTFFNKKLTSAIIPNSVKIIEHMAFYANELTQIIIPNSVIKIESSAFGENQLTSVPILNSITIIDYHTFFLNKIKHIEIPDGIKIIKNGAFMSNSASSIVIAASVVDIEVGAFHVNHFANVVIKGDCNRFDEEWYSQFQKSINIKKCE